MIWSPALIQEIVQKKFPEVSFSRNLESQLSSIETMELLLVLEKSTGVRLEAIELEPLLTRNFNLFCQIINDKSR